jgi:hypothetical protein
MNWKKSMTVNTRFDAQVVLILKEATVIWETAIRQLYDYFV